MAYREGETYFYGVNYIRLLDGKRNQLNIFQKIKTKSLKGNKFFLHLFCRDRWVLFVGLWMDRKVRCKKKRRITEKWKEKTKMRVKVYSVCLEVAMFLSVWWLINIFRSDSISQSLILAVFILVPDLMRLYFSTKIKSVKLRWLLLVINYLLATWGILLSFYGSDLKDTKNKGEN